MKFLSSELRTFRKTYLKLFESLTKSLRPRVKTPTAEWLEAHYNLPDVIGNMSGSYDFYYAPYFIGVANALDDGDTCEIVLMKAAQIGWTLFLLGYIAKVIDTDPCAIMGLFAKEADAKSFHDEKLIPSFQATTKLLGLIEVSKTRKAGVRWDLKTFAGGFLKLVGSNSPGNVKSTSSVGLGIVEEPDDTSVDVKSQGDAITLLEERLKRYVGSRLLVGGTPTLADLSKIEHRVKQTDRRELPISCHDCGEKHVLDWSNVRWDEDKTQIQHEIYGYADTESAVYACPNCGSYWDDDQRKQNIRDTVYSAVEAGDKMAGWVATEPFYGKAGFQNLSELYVCIPGTTLADVLRSKLNADYQAARGNVKDLVAFNNQRLGITFKYESTTPNEDELRARAEDYEEWTAPKSSIVLTAGIDVQRDRLAVIVRAWGVGMESWLIYWGELAAKTSTTDPNDSVWQDLADLLAQPVPIEGGGELLVQAMSIDSSDGYTAECVYNFVRKHRRKGYMAVKGSSSDTGTREIYTAPKKIDFKSQTKASKWGVQVFAVGTHKAKDLIFGDGGRLGLRGNGAGRMHWYKGVRDDYYTQLQGIVKAPNMRRGGRLMWQDKAGHPIEAIDCEVYALHAAYSLRLHTFSDAKWATYRAPIQQADLLDVEQDAPKEQQVQRRRKSSYW